MKQSRWGHVRVISVTTVIHYLVQYSVTASYRFDRNIGGIKWQNFPTQLISMTIRANC
jgi:hypothetical protein